MKLYFLAIALLIVSCNQEAKYNYNSYKVDSVSFPTNSAKRITSLKDISVQVSSNRDSIQKFLVLFKESRILNVYDLGTGKLVNQMKIPETQEQLMYKFTLEDSNLLMSFPGRIEILKNSQVLKTYYYEEKIVDNFYVYAYGNSGCLNLPSRNTFLLELASHGMEAEDEKSWLKLRYSQPSMGLFAIVGDSLLVTDTISYYPNSFQHKFHYSKHPQSTIAGNKIAYLFEDGDSISVYNMETKRRETVASIGQLDENYHPVLMNYDSTMNINYITKNFITSSRVYLFLYDNYRKVYYLGIKPERPYLSEDGTRVNDPYDFPLRLTVLDSNFKKLKRIDLPEGVFWGVGVNSFVAPKGLYLMRKPTNSNITYEIFDFTRNYRSH